jgi:hypothetical protein
MSGFTTQETVTGGLDDRGRPAWPRPPWVLVVGTVVLLGLGVVAGYLLGARTATARPAAAPTGVVVPEIVEGLTRPEEGNLTAVVATADDSAAYDYTLRGVPAIVPGGTLVGTPACPSPQGQPQRLELAVVHAQATAGGVSRDVAVWYRCAGG